MNSPATSFNVDSEFSDGIDPNGGERLGGGTFSGAALAVPEPGSLALLVAGLLGAGLARHRSKKAN